MTEHLSFGLVLKHLIPAVQVKLFLHTLYEQLLSILHIHNLIGPTLISTLHFQENTCPFTNEGGAPTPSPLSIFQECIEASCGWCSLKLDFTLAQKLHLLSIPTTASVPTLIQARISH